MSGSNTTIYDPEPPRSTCDRLTFNTHLNSPKNTVISGLKVGDVLDVVLVTAGAVKTVEAHHKGAVAGSITSGRLAQLISCIESGFSYAAKVTSISIPRVDVEIYAV